MQALFQASTLTPGARVALELRHQDMVRLPTGVALELHCQDGSVWITADHDLRDIVLQPGESHQSQPGQSLLVYALQAARVTVLAAAAAAGPVPAAPVQSARKAAFSWALTSGRSANGSLGLRA